MSSEFKVTAMQGSGHQIATTCCPACRQEQFVVTITDSGSGPSEWGTCHWFHGYGVCANCGYEGEYSDSSH